jgi:hypothetical protein
MCLEYAIDAGFPEAAKLANELRDKMSLSANQQSRISSMLAI